MDIAFVYDAVYPYVRGGAERRNYELGRRLAMRGHTVRHVSWQYWEGPADQRREDGTWLHGIGKPVSLHDANGKRTFRQALAFTTRCAPVVAQLPSAVIDCSSIPYLPAIALAPMARVRQRRLAVTWHEFMGERWSEYAGRRATFARVAERTAARCGQLRIAVSPFTGHRLPKGPKTVVVPNGIDFTDIRGARSVTSSDVVTVGRLVPHKRIDLLLQALVESPQLRATVVGDGPDRPRLERMAEALGVAGRVTFTGAIESDADVVTLIKGAGCLLLASEQEGFGMTVIEAMAAGTPPVVVSSEFSGASDLIAQGRDGILVDAAPRLIAKTIESICGDGPTRDEMSKRCIETARGFDWDAVTDQLLEAYMATAPLSHSTSVTGTQVATEPRSVAS